MILHLQAYVERKRSVESLATTARIHGLRMLCTLAQPQGQVTLRLLNYLRALDQSTHSCHLHYLSKDVSFLSQNSYHLASSLFFPLGVLGKGENPNSDTVFFCSQVMVSGSFLKMKNFSCKTLLHLFCCL